jgi:hypothetical protein
VIGVVEDDGDIYMSRSWKRRSGYTSPGGLVVCASKLPVDDFRV